MNSHANVALYFAAVVVIITAVARLMLVEFFQFVKIPIHYFLNFENCIELFVYVSSLIFVSHFGANCWCPKNWQWQLGSLCVFFAWINFILFLKKVAHLGVYVLMFITIFRTFLKFAVIAILFVFAFCLSFYMVLYKAVSVTAVKYVCIWPRLYMVCDNIMLTFCFIRFHFNKKVGALYGLSLSFHFFPSLEPSFD